MNRGGQRASITSTSATAPPTCSCYLRRSKAGAIAKTIVLIQDNLNVHSKASHYEAFPAAEARRLVERFEWHYTPKHGSWLDLAVPGLKAGRLSTAQLLVGLKVAALARILPEHCQQRGTGCWRSSPESLQRPSRRQRDEAIATSSPGCMSGLFSW